MQIVLIFIFLFQLTKMNYYYKFQSCYFRCFYLRRRCTLPQFHEMVVPRSLNNFFTSNADGGLLTLQFRHFRRQDFVFTKLAAIFVFVFFLYGRFVGLNYRNALLKFQHDSNRALSECKLQFSNKVLELFPKIRLLLIFV